ncbi:hypothetical protein A374_03729 [Fictibacillus macauensis ZFHKF-1]|uniref:Uncharacterized protein n=1 Tax=Fictibacillus macauensis ZFHKF-1 TaxID=1196324 RepID=I8UID1_9BACL|nr:hypothetical protein [Fictibacillus macauensis]EIT86650.1 hypothetical protein A374_03729 [Fictibacillus macauensis ZFHKF-1]
MNQNEWQQLYQLKTAFESLKQLHVNHDEGLTEALGQADHILKQALYFELDIKGEYCYDALFHDKDAPK